MWVLQPRDELLLERHLRLWWGLLLLPRGLWRRDLCGDRLTRALVCGKGLSGGMGRRIFMVVRAPHSSKKERKRQPGGFGLRAVRCFEAEQVREMVTVACSNPWPVLPRAQQRTTQLKVWERLSEE